MRTILSHTLFAMVCMLILVEAGCERREKQSMDGPTIESVLKLHSDSLMAVMGVVGTAIGEDAGKPCIKVYVAKRTIVIETKIPKSLEGYPVVLEETGEIRAQDK
jgi:hypothetical protein